MATELDDKRNALRRRAEELLRNKEDVKTNLLAHNFEELVENLKVYQFELEIQNEELLSIQQSLEQSKDKFEKLFNHAPIGYCTLNLEGVIIQTNLAFKQLLNINSEYPVGRHLSHFVKEDSQDNLYFHLKKTVLSPDGHSSLIAFLSNSSVVYAKLHSLVFKFNSIEEEVILCTINDITNEVIFQSKLQDSESRFRSLVDSIDDVVFTLDTEQKHTGVYGQWLSRYNQTPSDYIDKTSVDIMGAEKAAIHVENNRKALSGQNVVYDWESMSSQGLNSFQTSLSPMFNLNGQVVGIVGVARDITSRINADIALKERMKELNSLYRLTALAHQHGETIAEYLLEALDIVRSGFKYPSLTHVRITLDQGIYYTKGFIETSSFLTSDIEVKGVLVGRIDVFCDFSSSSDGMNSFMDEEQTLLSALANHIGQTVERMWSEIEINDKNQALEKLNAEKDKLFSLIGHDLRSPLASIIGLSELLEEKYDSLDKDKRIFLVQSINKATSKLYQLLENLLEWANLQRGAIEFNPKNINLLSIANTVQSLYEESFNSKKIICLNNIPSDIIVFVDNYMVQSILRNLISNAVKFTNEGGTVLIDAEKVDEKMVEITISDNGIGMDSKILNDLFRIQGNVGRTGTNGEPSSGLGLLLCKEFTLKHGGKIWAQSQEGVGSDFIFTLPLS
jgi:PAS domain S-box-containing protein